ncbi:hypothetical protein EJB05_25996 [Eragrostis curvula]|uniref:Protein kinase domain-containing protein n=1 Tax=Eragrostis curvula TaxID=38414 RepID=A0A5J9UKA5_9POAL|nr:hypothetical protein EJB05_25996 [Eragrostis curvula]
MALWSCLEPTATVAQVAGVDAGGLVSMILTAVQTVRRNKEDCRQLARRAMKIADLLQKLQSQDMMQDKEVWRPLDGLDDTLREAYVLVASCQESSITYRFFMGWKQADQFREVQRKIDGYVELYPFVMHLDLTQRLNRLCNATNDPLSQGQVAEEIVGSSGSCSNLVARTEGSTILENTALPANEPSAVDEHQQADDDEATVILSARKGRSIWLCWWPREKKRKPTYDPWLLHHDSQGYSAFHLSELSSATNNFAVENVIGRGGFGTVYKGQMRDGLKVAVKKCSCLLSDSNQGQLLQEYRNEVQFLMKLHHRNIVKLLGYCIEQEAMILVYEYIPNKSLDRFIFGKTERPLNWSERFRIIKGVAQARMIVSNVHEEYNSGESSIRGTFGYVAPEIIGQGIYSTKNDVYSFGVLLIEIIAGKRRVLLPDEGHSCGKYVHEYVSSGIVANRKSNGDNRSMSTQQSSHG